MRFASDLEELQHWMGLLTIDLQMGAERRHILAEARLCWLLVEKLERRPKSVDRSTFDRITLEMLNLQRVIHRTHAPEQAKTTANSEAKPRLMLVGKGTER
jgi:hypothetical protein